MSSFLKNAWYVAAYSDEVRRQLLRRVIMAEGVLLYRKENGTAVAMANRCAHRFAPLHLGELHGDTVSCPYHGLRYDASGQCVFNPNGDQHVPSSARLRTYPLVERYGMLWLWPGDSNRADPTQIPDLSYIEDRLRYTPVAGQMHVRANYRYIIDNLFDAAHLSTVHKGTLACESLLRARPEVKTEGEMIFANYICPPGLPSALWTQIWEAEHGPVPGAMDHWVTNCWAPGANILQETGITPVGQPRERGVATLNWHLLTPETEQTTHYFWGVCRSFQLNNVELNEQIRAGSNFAFSQEDEPMLSAIQEEAGDRDFWEMKPCLLYDDIGVTGVRRKMDQLLKAESAAPVPA